MFAAVSENSTYTVTRTSLTRWCQREFFVACFRQVNGVDFRGISHQQAVSVLKRCGSTADIVCQYVPEGLSAIVVASNKTTHTRTHTTV